MALLFPKIRAIIALNRGVLGRNDDSMAKFSGYSMVPGHPDYEFFTARLTPIYAREGDIRTPFGRDYTRVLHSLAYRRLKHKTQVFYNVGNDHTCTRMEHVSHVESVSENIAAYLGLNRELARAIAVAHDLGHAPFGHQGERVIDRISKERLGVGFWHEQAGLRMVDDLELLEDDHGVHRPLNLTYAVRDGIISHCGEVDENGIRPRAERIDLADFTQPGQYQPATWEGCVVKISDKIAYLGRDIEDALRLSILSEADRKNLCDILGSPTLNVTVLMNDFVRDLCQTSDPDRGICLSADALARMNAIKGFNYQYIYANAELNPFNRYSELILTEIFRVLHEAYDGENTFARLESASPRSGELTRAFSSWLARYCSIRPHPDYAARPIFSRLENESLYDSAILAFISGMTDNYAINAFNALISF